MTRPSDSHLLHQGERRFCEAFIDVPGFEWTGTYCKLFAGHVGPCSPHYPEPEAEAGADYSPHANVGWLS